MTRNVNFDVTTLLLELYNTFLALYSLLYSFEGWTEHCDTGGIKIHNLEKR